MKLLKDTNWFVPLTLVVLITLSLPSSSQAADNTICEGLSGAAFGLCKAYCEAMECGSDNPLASAEACQRVYYNFSKLTGNIPPCVDEMIAFVTSTTYTGDLGGLLGADLKCQTQAVAARLPGTYKAWLSDSTVDASQRLTHSNLSYVRVDGVKIAENWNALVGSGGSILNKLNLTEFGDAIPVGDSVWTATNYPGVKTGCWPDNPSCGAFCQDWTVSASGIAMVGNPNETIRQWTEALTWDWLPGYIPAQPCSSLQHLYCFQQ